MQVFFHTKGAGWGGRREAQEGRKYVYTWLIHVIVQHKIIQYCKTIILQLKQFFKMVKDLGQSDIC